MKRITIPLVVALLGAATAEVRAQAVPGLRADIQRAVHEPFSGPITAAKIRTAIDDAVMFLRSQQATDGSIGETSRHDRYFAGPTSLAALAMLAAGGHPASDDQLKKALDWLARLQPNNTYVRGIRANVWEYALRKVPHDQRIRQMLKADFEWLLAALGDRRAWRYNMQSRDWDNSCTQYGVLGIWAAARAGFEPGEEFWITMSKHFRDCQNADGGWGYTRSASSANMATAGLASMFLVFDMHHGKSFYSAENPRTFTEGEAAEVLRCIQRGMTWLGKATGSKNTAYYLYGIERTGVAGGRKYIGGEDWFAGGSQTVLTAQQPNGLIPLGRYGGTVVGTSFCTLFLVYGGAPVAVEKLQYGPGHDWNLNPRDLANLSKYLWSAYERPLNWQTVSIRAESQEDGSPEDGSRKDEAREFEAPILLITGSKAAKFSEEEMLRLRRYVLGGGTILAEPSDHSRQFADSIQALLRQMFSKSDYPTYELKPLPADHGIYTVIRQQFNERPKLNGVSDGSRVFLVLSEEYMSADWQVNRTGSDAFKLAMNLLFYATDLGTLEGRYGSILPAGPAAKPRQEAIRFARVRHDGSQDHPRDWDAARLCWQQFAPYARHVTGCKLVEARPVTPGKDDLKGIRLLHLTGRGRLSLSSPQRAALKRFVTAGGTLLVDAYAGSPEFAAAARAELEAVFGSLQPLPADHLLAEGRFQGGVDLSAGVRLKLPARQLLRRRGETSSGQKLQVFRIDGRPAVVFSEFDLSAAMAGIENYRSLGYRPDSARRIVGNLLAYVMAD